MNNPLPEKARSIIYIIAFAVSLAAPVVSAWLIMTEHAAYAPLVALGAGAFTAFAAGLAKANLPALDKDEVEVND